MRCYYFTLPQRLEDRVLDVLVRKTQTISRELGSLSPVIERKLSRLMNEGIEMTGENQLTRAIEDIDTGENNTKGLITEELEAIRPEKQRLIQSQMTLEKMLSDSRQWLGLDRRHFQDALGAALELSGAKALEIDRSSGKIEDQDKAAFCLPDLEQLLGADPNWAKTLDTLRSPRGRGQNLWDWRKSSPPRPIVFQDPGSLDGKVVHLHLEHRLVQRLLSRFLAQGFLYHELSKACVCLTQDPIPKVVVLGRLSLYGDRASRLHDEVIAVAAEWLEPEARGRGKLRPLSDAQKKDVLEELEDCLGSSRSREVSPALLERFKNFAARDVAELTPHLERRAGVLCDRALALLSKRGSEEAKEMKKLLQEQRQLILKQEDETKAKQLSLFTPDESRQLEADRRHWQKRLQDLEREIITEPERIEQAYEVRATRIEPVGLVYLWPVSN
ncbi:MAG: hypothetical protein N5P05_001776 [Chroococcopsis gigantea SAG 12.99]|nr:hypothetical protein [Chroococcopsis gigantea SAG 12.99]